MKKKTTRKIRKNKRATTQRRKNRSYKRMRGGVKWFQEKKIVKLLTNLIINLSVDIRKLCQQPLLPTAEQPLLSTAQQPLLLNAEKVNELLITTYNNIIPPMQNTGPLQYKFRDMNDPTTETIIEALKAQGISYFDRLVEDESIVDIFSPDNFKDELTTVSQFRTIFGPNKVLVYSMFALAYKIITFKNIFNTVPAKINLTEPVCHPIAADI